MSRYLFFTSAKGLLRISCIQDLLLTMSGGQLTYKPLRMTRTTLLPHKLYRNDNCVDGTWKSPKS